MQTKPNFIGKVITVLLLLSVSSQSIVFAQEAEQDSNAIGELFTKNNEGGDPFIFAQDFPTPTPTPEVPENTNTSENRASNESVIPTPTSDGLLVEDTSNPDESIAGVSYFVDIFLARLYPIGTREKA
ncbi:MAG: hypothetical protein HYZ21_02750 [Chloroflexi bacterium]|nr:hypothetical protein [Chloroflexota bacterium]